MQETDEASLTRFTANTHIINNNKIKVSFVSKVSEENTLTSSAQSTCCSRIRRRCKKVEINSPLAPVLMRLNERKSVMRTKLRALMYHSLSQQQECTRNAVDFIVSQNVIMKN